jgi:hypothetical protein
MSMTRNGNAIRTSVGSTRKPTITLSTPIRIVIVIRPRTKVAVIDLTNNSGFSSDGLVEPSSLFSLVPQWLQ